MAMKKQHLLILSTLAAIIQCVSSNGRIFGGSSASPAQFPFVVSLNDPDVFCSGAIINSNWILTTAQCLFEVTNTTTVLVGTNSQSSDGTTYNISNFIQHEEFITIASSNDIGLIQIDGSLVFGDTIQAIDLVDPGVNSTCFAMGWGLAEDDTYPEDLRFVETTALDNQDCLEISGVHIGSIVVGPEQVCALATEGEGVCFGDLGGPLVCDGKLAGVASYPIMACAMGFPDLYTRVVAYTDWINSHINKLH